MRSGAARQRPSRTRYCKFWSGGIRCYQLARARHAVSGGHFVTESVFTYRCRCMACPDLWPARPPLGADRGAGARRRRHRPSGDRCTRSNAGVPLTFILDDDDGRGGRMTTAARGRGADPVPGDERIHGVRGSGTVSRSGRMVGHFLVGASGSVPAPSWGPDSPQARACRELAAAVLADVDPTAATAPLVEAAAGCARDGVALASVHRAVFDAVRREFERQRTTAIPRGADRSLGEPLETVTVAVSPAYLDEARVHPPHQSVVDTVTASLLGGIADPAEADECGIELAAT